MSLTKHPPGSLRELWAISYPLMLSAMAVSLMLFVDRAMLAYYSQDALNAAVIASTVGWVFLVSITVLTNISEVFVAQYNGSGEVHKLGEPIWQMIWVSLASTLFFLPLAFFGGSLFFYSSPLIQLESDYFFWITLFGPIHALYGALSAFFIGQGKVHIITILALSANFINIFLDYALIFGVPNLIPSLGVQGAAIATSGSELFQTVILASFFLSKKNRRFRGTRNYRLSKRLLWNCLKIGIPTSLLVAFEICGWAFYYKMLSYVSLDHITIAGIFQSIFILFYFFGEGMSKGAITIVGNLIGAKKKEFINQLLHAGLILHLLFFGVLLSLLFLFSDLVINHFLTGYPKTITPDFLFQLRVCLYLVAPYLLFEGIRFLFSGILIGAGDTRFLLITGALGIWFFLIIPVYLIVVQYKANNIIAISICLFHCIAVCLLYAWRFFNGRWKKIQIAD